MKNQLPRYTISLNPEDALGPEKLGMDFLAMVSKPAILTKGIAFDAKQLTFKDELKMRVAAPALIPNLPIYRFDDILGEYEVVFTEEVIEQLRADFMLNKGEFAFNLDHDSNQKVPAYILDSWITEEPENDPSFTKYGIKVPKGSWFVVTQFTNKEYFQNEIINKDRAAYSIEGFLGLALSQIKQKLNKEKMENETKQKFSMHKLIDGTPVWISALEVNGEVFIVDENMERAPIFDGTHELEDGTKMVTIDGKITEVIAKAEEPAAEEVVEEVMAEEPVAEEVAEEVIEEAVGEIDEAAILAIIQPKLDELYAVIAELKTLVETSQVGETSTETVEMSAADKLNFAIEKLRNF
jgi:hypothetical protein